jgi:D-alanyl-D-alanine carboxypeptidase
MKYKMTTLYVLVIALFAVFALPITSAQSPDKLNLPDTPAGKRAAAVLKIIEQGGDGEATIRQFLNENFAPSLRDASSLENHIARIRKLQQDLAGSTVAGIRMRSPAEIELMLKTSGGSLMSLSVRVAAEAPQLIDGLRLAEAKPPFRLDFSTYAELDAKLKTLSETGGFAGVVLVASGEKIAFEKAYGLADRDKGIPNRTDTMFDIGSISKLFTAVAVLKLAQEGRLDLDDKIGKYLKNLPAEIGDKVTVRHLLQMRSGMGDFLRDRRYREKPENFRKVSDYLEIIRTAPLMFEPGTREAYSNTGYVALGAVIEAVTKKSYDEVIENYVYQPANMKSSGSFDRTGGNKNMAIGYTRPEGPSSGGIQLIANTNLFAPVGNPAGGGFSTAQDLKRFVEALFAGKLLDREHTRLFLNRFEPPQEKENSNGRPFNRAGGSLGVNAVMLYDPARRDLVIVLANRDLPIAEDIGRAVAEKLAKK